ncbi:hypothetical protein AAMO2058_000417500 [Amorphochlora amoebiformis]
MSGWISPLIIFSLFSCLLSHASTINHAVLARRVGIRRAPTRAHGSLFSSDFIRDAGDKITSIVPLPIAGLSTAASVSMMNNAARVYDLAKGTPIGDGARLVGDVVLSHPKAVLVTSGAAIAAGVLLRPKNEGYMTFPAPPKSKRARAPSWFTAKRRKTKAKPYKPSPMAFPAPPVKAVSSSRVLTK